MPESPTILIVDDEEDICEVIQLKLSEHGIKALVASNGLAALEIITRTPVDYVLTDVRMPKMGGMELLRKVNQMKGRDPSVFLMSGYKDVDQEEVIKSGGEGIFHKLEIDKVVDNVVQLTKDKISRGKGR